MDDIKISVVVPVYNIENYIKKTTESIINQTHQNMEVILVDDGSTDNSGKIIDSIAEQDNRIKVIHKTNGGVTSARITGIKAATGDWIGFVDGDDYIEPEMYEILLQNAVQHHADISHCGYQMVFPSRVDYYHNTRKLVIQNHEQGLYDLMEGSFVEPGLWNKLVKAPIAKKVAADSIIDLSIKINEDLLMNYYFFKLSNSAVYYDICPYHYMLRKGSAATSKVNENKLYDPIRVQKLILVDVGNNELLSNIIIGRLARFYISGASMNNPEKKPFIDEYIKMCRRELTKLSSRYLGGSRSRFDKIKFRLCCFSPALYRCFHKMFAIAKGTDKKYEVR